MPLSTRTVRATEPMAIGLAKVSVLSEWTCDRIRAAPVGTNEPDPHVTWAGVVAPPRFTVRAAPVAAKPPPGPVNCTWSTPVPRARVKLPWARSTTPPESVRPLVPPVVAMPPGREPAAFSRRAPPETVVVPLKVFVPPRASVPSPTFVRPRPAPASPIAPPTVSTLTEEETVRSPPSVTAPVPRFRFCEPTKLKSPDQVWALLVVSTRFAAELSRLPPAIVRRPEPAEPAALNCRVPAETVMPPGRVFVPLSRSVPQPVFCRLALPPTAPPRTSRPWGAITLTCEVPEEGSVTLPLSPSALMPSTATLPSRVTALATVWLLP